MSSQYDVFLSFKNLDADGERTRDSQLAEQIFHFLGDKEVKVFYSNLSLEALGTSAYKEAIDDALDQARILVAVGTSPENLASRWVRYEWDSFFSDILSDIKREGRVFVYFDGPAVNELPRALRQAQVIEHAEDSFERLYRFIAAALGRGRPSSLREGLAVAFHEQHRLEMESVYATSDTQVRTWEDLPDDVRKRMLALADDWIAYIGSLGYEIRQAKGTVRRWRQSPDEIQRLAQLEHERWCREREDAGWQYGPTRDVSANISPYLVPWESLPDDNREVDREEVRRWPDLLISVGAEVVPSGGPS